MEQAVVEGSMVVIGCIDKILNKGTIKFEIAKFDGNNHAIWKENAHTILAKDSCSLQKVNAKNKHRFSSGQTLALKD